MDLIASLQCADQPGIVHAMTSAVLACGGNIIKTSSSQMSQQIPL